MSRKIYNRIKVHLQIYLKIRECPLLLGEENTHHLFLTADLLGWAVPGFVAVVLLLVSGEAG